MRRKLLPLILGGALSIAAVAPAAANHDGNTTTDCTVQNAGRGGAAALVALVNANLVLPIGATVCDIDVLNNSLNNLLQNADIDVLSNILNNSEFLNNFNITVGPIANGVNVSVLTLGNAPVTSINFEVAQ